MAKRKQDAGYVSPGISAPKGPDYVVVELQHDSKVAYTSRNFSGPDSVRKSIDALNKVLEGFNVRKIASHLGMKAAQIRERATAAPPSLTKPVSAEFAHSGFVQVVPKRNKDAVTLAKRLNRASVVWQAVVEPRPVPAAVATGNSTVSRNFEPTQGYLCSPPYGVGAMDVWKAYNAKGRGVTICDIEGNWNRRHEDLPSVTLIGGTVINTLGWKNHGTAVLGEMVSKPGRKGTVGISHQAKAVVHSAMIAGVFNTAGAIANATRRLRQGDVILIELQGTGPRGKYVAMQYWNSVFSAIRAAVAKGITVVEAAGNGNENFQNPIYRGTGLQRDSGAIVVGAGIPPTNYFDTDGAYDLIGVPRSRI